MATPISNNLQLNAPKALDSRYCKFSAGQSIPYQSTDEANSTIPLSRRYEGLTVLVESDQGSTEYWYLSGIQNENLIVKSFANKSTESDMALLATVQETNSTLQRAQLDVTNAESQPFIADPAIILLLNSIVDLMEEMKNSLDSIDVKLNNAQTGQSPFYILDVDNSESPEPPALRVFLQGAWRGSEMGTELRGAGLLPFVGPYIEASEMEDPQPVDVVDWVLVGFISEADFDAGIRAATDPVEGLLLKDGRIVDATTVQPVAAPNTGSFHIGLEQRNHLIVYSSVPVNMTSGQPINYDFTTAQNKAYQNPAVTTNAAMVEVSPGVFGMWGGDANGDGVVKAQGAGNDSAAVSTKANTYPDSYGENVYVREDVNMDGLIYATDPDNDSVWLLINPLQGNPANIRTAHT